MFQHNKTVEQYRKQNCKANLQMGPKITKEQKKAGGHNYRNHLPDGPARHYARGYGCALWQYAAALGLLLYEIYGGPLGRRLTDGALRLLFGLADLSGDVEPPLTPPKGEEIWVSGFKFQVSSFRFKD